MIAFGFSAISVIAFEGDHQAISVITFEEPNDHSYLQSPQTNGKAKVGVPPLSPHNAKQSGGAATLLFQLLGQLMRRFMAYCGAAQSG